MASKFALSLSLLSLLLLCQTLNGIEMNIKSKSETKFRGHSCRDCCFYALRDSVIKNTHVTAVGVDKITHAIRASGHSQTLPTILEKSLFYVMGPYCDDFVFFIDRKNRFTVYGQNSTVTIFVPPEDKIRYDEWFDLEYQILTAKIDEEAFFSGSLSEGSVVKSLSWPNNKLVVDRVFENGTVSINGVKVTKWNIYNDGLIIVHGTEGFFDEYRGKSPIYDTLDVKSRMEIYEDPRDGWYRTRIISFLKADGYPEEFFPWPLY